jgi:single-strand DNA-binding protein
MANVNKVILIGNLTRDPELKFLPSSTAVCEFGIAVNRKWKEKSGEEKEEVTFVDCSAFGNQAETLNKYVKKGSPIYLEGRLKLDQWDAQDGTKRSKMRVIVDHFQFLSSGRGEDQEQQPARQAPPKTAAPAPGYGSRRPPAKQPTDASMRPSDAARIMAADSGEGLDDVELPF